MAYVMLGLFLVVVSVLTIASMRRGGNVHSCCAPADPADDLRMRPAFQTEDEQASPNVTR